MASPTSTEFFERWSTSGKESLKPLIELRDIIARAFEQSARQNIGTYNAFLSDSANHFQKLINMRKLEDFVALQAKVPSDAATKCIDLTQQTLDTWLDTQGELSKWVENTFAKHPYEEQSKTTKTKTG